MTRADTTGGQATMLEQVDDATLVELISSARRQADNAARREEGAKEAFTDAILRLMGYEQEQANRQRRRQEG